MSGSYLVEGLVYEFIARPCGYRYTTPLGLWWGSPPWARIYASTRLYSLLKRGGVNTMTLYAPVDPLDFARSVLHELEYMIDVDSCDPQRPFIVAYKCEPRIVKEEPDYIDVECPGELVEGRPTPYTRLYGGIVEALVVASKIGAGVIDGELAEDCMRCARYAISRASRRASLELWELLQAAIQRLRGPRGVG